MKTPTWNVTPQAVACLVRASGGRSAPDGPDFGPRGPIGPIAYELYRRFSDRFQAVALNPQPIPPVDEVARLLAQSFVSQVAAHASLSASEGKAGVSPHTAKMIGDFEEWCGTGRLAKKLAEMLEKLNPKGGDRPPRPQEEGWLQLIVGAELYAARDLAPGLGATGESVMAQGMKQQGFMA